ncbi:response regulator [Motiliproteus coralliicola]|uniref:Response regulator n=1 Tax=Motiliproteus coralliicola TaxID=2283196 RepID=A0A369WV65_9GAMM|nr:HD domain-containing phosphohydrolase [Motiliproteus coralliicola]RDE24444.1 response regulator [Motiliproteus coralliicola]
MSQQLEANPHSTEDAKMQKRYRLLFVDDEPNVLSSLRRLFRPLGFQIFLAESGYQGLDILEEQSIDLIISDMRMPGMDGAEFFERVEDKYPDIPRLLLTGQADLEQTISAINKGKISRYTSKPWDDNELILTVNESLKIRQLMIDKQNLTKLTESQNKMLKGMNQELEKRVEARTAELKQTAEMLELSFTQLNDSYLNIIRVFSNLIGMRESLDGRYTKQVADMSKRLAKAKGLDEHDIKEVYMAALLHEIGKLVLPDSIVDRPVYNLDRKSRGQYRRHPLMGQHALMAVEALHDVGKLVRCHEEKWNGSGFPDGLSGESIPLGARIIGIANDYFGYLYGRLHRERLSPLQALELMVSESGALYDPELINLLKEDVRQQKTEVLQPHERKLSTDKLTPGMRLSRDLYNSADMLLLTKRRVLNTTLIEKLRAIEHSDDVPFEVYVYEELAK